MTTLATTFTLFVVPAFSLVLLPVFSSIANPRTRSGDLDSASDET